MLRETACVAIWVDKYSGQQVPMYGIQFVYFPRLDGKDAK